MNILFYDDEFRHKDNEILCDILRIEIPSVIIDYVHSVDIFELVIKKFTPDIIILDLMGPETSLKEYDSGRSVNAEHIGIELLRRVRSGFYMHVDNKVKVAIRTAKCNPKTKRICKEMGADHFFCAGIDDSDLIDLIIGMERRVLK